MPEYKLTLPDYLDEEQIEWIIHTVTTAVSREVSKGWWDLEEIDT